MMRNVNTYMSKTIIDIDGSNTVLNAVKIMKEKSISSLLVKAEDEYVGIFTSTDLLRKVVGQEVQPDWMMVSDAMTKGFESIPHDATMANAFLIMEEKSIHHLVVRENEKVVGMLSIRDAARCFAENFKSTRKK